MNRTLDNFYEPEDFGGNSYVADKANAILAEWVRENGIQMVRNVNRQWVRVGHSQAEYPDEAIGILLDVKELEGPGYVCENCGTPTGTLRKYCNDKCLTEAKQREKS